MPSLRRAYSLASCGLIRVPVVAGFALLMLLVGGCDTSGDDNSPEPEESAIELTWYSIDRYGVDLNLNSLIDIPNTPGYVQAKPGLSACPASGCKGGPPAFEIELVADAAKAWPTDARFVWSNTAPDGTIAHEITTTPQLTVILPEGSHEVALEVFDASGATLGKAKTAVDVEDIFIAALGSTLLSGDGAPEMSVVSPNLVRIGIENGEAAGVGGTRLDVVWGDSGATGAVATVHFRFESVVPSGPSYYAESFGGDPVSYDHARARRSSRAIPSLAALSLEKEDPHTSVTLVNLAASGATLDVGVLGPYAGVPSEPLSSRLPPMSAQLDALASLAGCESEDEDFVAAACARQVDALVLSVGYSDIGFPTALAALLARDSQFFEQITHVTLADLDRGVATGNWNHLGVALDAVSSIIGGPELPRSSTPLDEIERNLDRLARRVADSIGDPAVFLLLVQDPFTGESGLCTSALGTATPLGDLDAQEVEWLRSSMIGALNAVLVRAAAKHTWTVVGSPEARSDGHGICDPAALMIGNESGQIYPAPLTDPSGAGVRWVLDAREAALIVGGSKTTMPPTLFPNSHGRRYLAALLAEAVRDHLGT